MEFKENEIILKKENEKPYERHRYYKDIFLCTEGSMKILMSEDPIEPTSEYNKEKDFETTDKEITNFVEIVLNKNEWIKIPAYVWHKPGLINKESKAKVIVLKELNL
jgi:beta-galactosidase beta subunit